MKHRIVLIAILLPLFLAAAAPCAASITVKIVNDTEELVYVLLTGDPLKPLTVSGITANVSTPLSSLTDNQFTLSALSAGRIIFSFNGSVPANQQPLDPSARFDKVELTYPGTANLTAVDFFGIPFKLETLDGSGNVLQTLTFYTSTNSLLSILEALAQPAALITTTGIEGGPFARILSPELSPSSYPSMQSYVNAIGGSTVTINGTYTGKVGPNPNTYNYSGTFGNDGTITLTGTMTQPATPNSQPLTVDGTTLASAIYTNNGSYTVDNAANNPQQVSNNDVYAAIYRDMIAGFDFGYIGGKYGSNSASWYGTTPYHPSYACARTSNDGYYNKYASIIAANSDAYGFPFSDVNQPVQVDLNASGTGDVAMLRITVLPDNMVDAPIIQSMSSDNASITVNWSHISGATDYTVRVSPPIPAHTVDVGTSTSATIPNLSPGTPYTVSVVASNGISTSEAMPVVVSTMGSVTPVTEGVTWNFVPNFTGTFPSGHTITFNGTPQALPTSANPAMQFNDVFGQPGQQNAYVFQWTDGNQSLVFSSILYVQLDANPSTGMGSIDHAPTVTFMAANQHIPTYDEYVFNLYLSIAPNTQRTVCATELPDPSLAVTFGPQGLWLYRNAAWNLLTGVTPNLIASYGNKLVANFPAYGLYQYDGTAWTQLTPNSGVENLLGASGKLYADFGDAGLWQYDGAWTQLSSVSPDKLLANGNKLVAAFTGFGLYEHDGTSWTQLTAVDTIDNMLAISEKVYVDFGNIGLWRYDGGWTNLSSANPNKLQAYNGKLVANFPDFGLYEHDVTSWTQLTANATVVNLLGIAGNLYADFGGALGLYRYNGAWTQLSGADASLLGSYGEKLVANFSAYGLYEYDGSGWTPLTGNAGATDMVGVDLP